MQSIAVIMNPIAGSKRGRLDAEGVRDLLQVIVDDVEILSSDAPGVAVELAARAAERHSHVLAVGGDGTISEVAQGLSGSDATMAVWPTGSGNDFAKGLGIGDLKTGVACLQHGRTRRIDTASFASRFFVNTCGLFFSGEVSIRAASVARYWGSMRYPIATLDVLGRDRAPRAAWKIGDVVLDERWTLAEIGNGVQCGGGFKLTPQADPGDGMLDFCLLRRLNPLALLALLPRGLSGRHLGSPHVSYLRSDAAIMECEEPVAVHWDGEAAILPAGAWSFSLDPRALKVLVPKEAA